MTRPLIGITSYAQPARWGAWELPAALVPFYYVESVERAGGRALVIPPSTEAVDETLEVHGSRGIPVGMDLQVTVFVDGEVTLPPAGHVVEFARFRNRPGARSGRGGAGPQASACKCAHRRDHRINVSAPNASDKFRSYVVETGIGVPSASMATRTTSASVTFTRSPRWPALQRSTSTSTLTVTDVRPTRRVSV